jgi:ATP-dependent Clp protease protease subunit
MAKNKKKAIRRKIDIDQILLQHRQVYLFDVIDSKLANKINKELFALDRINHKPIILRINSGGGSLPSGFSIIDTMKAIHSPVITCVTGYACSMAGIISVAGEKRVMFKHAIWMGHDMQAYIENYVTKMIDYTDFLKKLQKRMFEFLGKHTKLSQAELTKARNGELWFFANEAKKKGICDIIVE